jgi:DNA-binding Xre family transcriptional regulator
MNIKHDIQTMLTEAGWPAARLAEVAGVPAPVITRLLSGKRKGLHTSTLCKLWPYVYGDKRPAPVAQ